MREIGCIVKRDGSVVPFDAGKITVAVYKAFASMGVHDRPLAEDICGKVVAVLLQAYSTESPPTVEDIQDVVEDTLIREGHAQTAKRYIIYRFKRAQARREVRTGPGRARDPIPYRILWRDFIWNVDHGVDTAGKMNALMDSGGFPELVAGSEKRYEDQIDRAAEEITAGSGRIRTVIVAGPSSSGKTTTTMKLCERLEAAGIGLRALNVDNYYFDINLHPRDSLGDYDYETPEALDMGLLSRHIGDLVEGREIQSPLYDFKSGRRIERTLPVRLGENEILLLDCLHGLYDQLSEAVPAGGKFSVYIETFEQIRTADNEFVRWADIRLLRRMVRDRLQRSYDPRKTLMHWHYVRRGEMKHIIPFVHDADFIVNSALPYEIPVLKHLLAREFPAFIEEFRGQKETADAFIRASRVQRMLSGFRAAEDHSAVPPKSLLREFIGGSSYVY